MASVGRGDVPRAGFTVILMNTKGVCEFTSDARGGASSAPLVRLRLQCPDPRFEVPQPRLDVGAAGRLTLLTGDRSDEYSLARLTDHEACVAQLADRCTDDRRGHAERLGQASGRRQLAAHGIGPRGDRGPQAVRDLEVLRPASVIDHLHYLRRRLRSLCTWCTTVTFIRAGRSWCNLTYKEYHVYTESKVKEW